MEIKFSCKMYKLQNERFKIKTDMQTDKVIHRGAIAPKKSTQSRLL